jgi:hypothetical protein
MRKAPNPFLIVALLVSIFVHLFLFDWAVGLTLKWQLFSTSAADRLFQIKDLDVQRKPEVPRGKPEWKPEEIIRLISPKKEAVAERETVDKDVLLESEKFITSDVTEQTLLEAIEKAIEAESVAKAEGPEPVPVAESIIAQEILAVDESLIKHEIPAARPRISASVKRGTATADIIFLTPTGPSPEPVPTGISRGPTGQTPGSTTPSEKKDMARLAMAEKLTTIPGVIAPPPPVLEKERPIPLRGTDVVDIVTEDYESIQKYPPLDDLLTVQLFTYHRPGESSGYFRLVIEPKKDRRDFRIIPKDIIFVVDSSKSITQRKLGHYVEGVKRCLKTLHPQDRFNVAEFKDFTNKFSPEDVVPATPEAIAKAEEFLSGLVSEGGTNVYNSLTELVTHKPTPGRPRTIFLVSDGRPTVGIRADSDIINEVTRLNALKSSVFTFAGGEKINTSLLDLLSYRNRGARTFERDDRKIAETLPAFFGEFNSPILLNPRFNFGSIDPTEVYPKVLSDLYLNGRLEMYGRFRSEGEFSMQLLGEADGVTKEYVLQQTLTGPDSGDESVASLWAFRKIYDLVGLMVQQGGAQTTLAEIRKLSADYKLETPYSPYR